ncbi:hypothetical protein SEA_GAIL_8 [Mycobacterium phage Gail]|uniref:Uncharacterized protein n=1 Tax=Mycobacterium phage Gail TaxID=2743994 RepID=A0A7D5JV30_9CAUD|nr:hypothetical protein KNV16_gp101 [Mycobacterium phage Gail]QLF84572.1 hypothetical protein SEA_GAIL_8 [Mycobacterium phage Gail]
MITKIKSAILMFALKKLVKYLVAHPDVIPGSIDDRVLPMVAKFLGV